MNQQPKKKDYGAAWVKQSQYGELISVCLPVEFVQELLQQARDGKIWVSLGSNSYKKEGSKQPDYKVLAPREQKFDAYTEQLPTTPPKKWEPPAKDQEVLKQAFTKVLPDSPDGIIEEDVPL